MKIKLMTFNAQHCQNYLSKKIDYNSIIDLIKNYNPDIIGLNEIFGNFILSNNQAQKIAKNLDYYYYFGKSTILGLKPYGNAILSKYPITDAKVIKIPDPKIKTGNRYYETRSILKATVYKNNTNINIYITHLGLNKDEQLNGINTLCSLLNDEKYIIMGDFNMNYNDKLLLPLKKYTIDTDIKIKGSKYTWPSDNPTIKDDYILTSKNIKIISASIPKEIVSDHLPYIAEIEI